MHIQIIGVGKVREKYLKLGIQEFEKRLQPYCKLTLLELADEQAPENLSDKQLQLVKNKEGERILSKIKESDYVIALDILGKQHTSEAFSDALKALSFQGKNKIIFLIGGSNGLSDAVLKRAN